MNADVTLLYAVLLTLILVLLDIVTAGHFGWWCLTPVIAWGVGCGVAMIWIGIAAGLRKKSGGE